MKNGENKVELIIREEELVPYNEIDYLPSDKIDIKKEYLKKLNDELKK